MKKLSKPVYVTKSALPPLDEFSASLAKIWDSRILTNNGPLHQQFERELADYLGVKYISLFANGTLALMTALQTLGIKGEVITTPFSFVATTHALWWNKIKPVFADIEDRWFNLDPLKVEALITEETSAILPVHVYGNPCDLEAFQKIGEKYGLRIIYDAAHAFGVKINGKSLLNFGDLSVLSFHATKTFNTIEGGAVVCHDADTKKRIDLLKNFGFMDETTVLEPGINGKMNEIQAAYGLLQLKHVDGYIASRREKTVLYRKGLQGIAGVRLIDEIDGVDHSYTYFAILIDEKKYGKSRTQVYERLKQKNVWTRRYFYPLISQLSIYSGLESAGPGKLPIAERVTEQVLCLPLFPDLSDEIIADICDFIRDGC